MRRKAICWEESGYISLRSDEREARTPLRQMGEAGCPSGASERRFWRSFKRLRKGRF